MTTGAQLVLGNDRVRSEVVGLGVADVQVGHQQRVASHLHVQRRSSAVRINNDRLKIIITAFRPWISPALPVSINRLLLEVAKLCLRHCQ